MTLQGLVGTANESEFKRPSVTLEINVPHMLISENRVLFCCFMN